MTRPLVVRLRPSSPSVTRWHLATFLGTTWLWGACGRLGGWRDKARLQITYGTPTCRWCKTLRLVGEQQATGSFEERLRTGDWPIPAGAWPR